MGSYAVVSSTGIGIMKTTLQKEYEISNQIWQPVHWIVRNNVHCQMYSWFPAMFHHVRERIWEEDLK